MGEKTQRAKGPGRAPLGGPKAPARGRGHGPDPGPESAPRVAGCVRVSQERNLERFGMDAQIADVMRYVKYRRWQAPEIYRENGVSGYKRERPALERLLADARAGKLDVVVFPSIDRAARSVTDMIDIDAVLREANATVVFVREGVDTSSPTGQFFRNICAAVAQFEGKLIHERLLKGLRRKAGQGGYTGGPLPYGYRHEPPRPGGKGRAVVVPEEADIVRLVFRMRLDGKSFRGIVGELHSRGMKTTHGCRWRHGTVVGAVVGCHAVPVIELVLAHLRAALGPRQVARVIVVVVGRPREGRPHARELIAGIVAVDIEDGLAAARHVVPPAREAVPDAVVRGLLPRRQTLARP